MANTFIFDDDEAQPEANAPAPEPTEPEQPESGEGGEGNNRNFLLAAIGLGGIVLISLICMAVYALVVMPKQRATAQQTSEANQAAVALATNVSMETQAAVLFTATLPPSETPVPQPTETLVVVFATPTPSVAPTSEPATATFEAMQTQVANNLLTAAATSASATVGAGTSVAGADAGTGTPGASGTARAGTSGTKVAAATAIPGIAQTITALGTSAAQGTPGALATRQQLIDQQQQLAKTGFADEVGLPGLFAISILLVAVILLARRLRRSPMSH
jgi:uncharacterized membrane protein